MRRVIFGVAGVCLIAALNCSVAWAQATAQISGTVRDQSGAVLPGVDVTVTQTETGVVRRRQVPESKGTGGARIVMAGSGRWYQNTLKSYGSSGWWLICRAK